jgi:hypothetical protein
MTIVPKSSFAPQRYFLGTEDSSGEPAGPRDLAKPSVEQNLPSGTARRRVTFIVPRT